MLVDAGNLLFKKALRVKNDPNSTTSFIIARGLVRAYKAMLYDAVAVSADDLSAGLDFFQQKNNDQFPWIAANVYDTNSSLLFPPHIIKRIATMTVGIIGLTGNDGQTIAGCIIGDWRTSLQEEISLLQKNCDMLVVLSNLSDAENRELQRDFKQIDIIVTADRKKNNIQPRLSAGSLLVQSGGRGKYFGKLDIAWHGQGNWFAAAAKTLQDDNKKQASKSYKSSILPINPAASGDSVDAIVLDVKESIKTYNKYRLADLQPADPLVRLPLQEKEMSGVSDCSLCHQKQTSFWKTTRHAGAYATLSRQGQSFNLQCLPCHVTAGKVNVSSSESELLLLLSLNPDRLTIGCEVCHGPGKRHTLSPEEVAPQRLPAEEICAQCHTSERDNNFSYQKKLAVIACPAE